MTLMPLYIRTECTSQDLQASCEENIAAFLFKIFIPPMFYIIVIKQPILVLQ